MSHCPQSFIPQATGWPSLRRSTVWVPPAETCVHDNPAEKGEMLHCPWKFIPHAIPLPSLRRSTVCLPPAETIADKNWAYANTSWCRTHVEKWIEPREPLSDQLAWGAPITMVKCIQYRNNPHCTSLHPQIVSRSFPNVIAVKQLVCEDKPS